MDNSARLCKPGPVEVAVRSRPLFLGENSCLHIDPLQHTITVGKEKEYTFDYVFSGDVLNELIHAKCVKPLIYNLIQGQNGTILASGQTGAGKTYTMGTDYRNKSMIDQDDLGIIPRTLKTLFSLMGEITKRYSVYISFLEIYNETIYDLLSDDRSIVLLQDGKKNVQLRNLKEMLVTDEWQALHYLELGSTKRTTGATVLNKHSSRSHAVFTIQIKSNTAEQELFSKLHLVDLAGTEGIRKTNTHGERRREGININLGLLSLKKVLNALSAHKTSFISYRESIVTRLFKDCLNTGSKILMISCVSPEDTDLTDTIETLRYSSDARNIPARNIVVPTPMKARNPLRAKLDNIPPTPCASSSLNEALPFSTPLFFQQPLNLNISPIETNNRNDSVFVRPNPPKPSVFKRPGIPQPNFHFTSPPQSSQMETTFDLNSIISPLAKRVSSRLEETLREKLEAFEKRNIHAVDITRELMENELPAAAPIMTTAGNWKRTAPEKEEGLPLRRSKRRSIMPKRFNNS